MTEQDAIRRSPDDLVRPGQDIDAMTGATISSRAMTDGVRQAVRVVRRQVKGAADLP